VVGVVGVVIGVVVGVVGVSHPWAGPAALAPLARRWPLPYSAFYATTQTRG